MPTTRSSTPDDPKKPYYDTPRSANSTEGTLDSDEPKNLPTPSPNKSRYRRQNLNNSVDRSARILKPHRPHRHRRPTRTTRHVNFRPRASQLQKENLIQRWLTCSDNESHIEELSTNGLEVSYKIDSQDQQYGDEHLTVEQLDEAIKTMADADINKTVYTKAKLRSSKLSKYTDKDNGHRSHSVYNEGRQVRYKVNYRVVYHSCH